jgi:3D-(3,5/4)-trihydroxycyclohexane-1,2-dione acylhydrolase (decyclizing)
VTSIRLTTAQAIVRYLAAQQTVTAAGEVPLFAGVWAIFGHGNVAAMGEALAAAHESLPTYRAHNEQAMAHAAIAFAKASNRRRMMACTSSIGPGATNMVTAAAVAHVNRLPVLLLPGDVYASRRPDPVLQQIEDFADATVSANDCFRPVSRYFDRITRPEQLLVALPRALSVLTDPAECGPVTLALCQDTQAEAFDFPVSFFVDRVHRPRRIRADEGELDHASELLKDAKRPMIIAGGGVHYSEACDTLREFAERHDIPISETQAGKSAIAWDHPLNLGSIGVTGTTAANACAEEADVVLAVGTRLQDFTTGSRSLFQDPAMRLIQMNVASFDVAKHNAVPVVGDAKAGLEELSRRLDSHRAPAVWGEGLRRRISDWTQTAESVLADTGSGLPSDAQVIGGVNRAATPDEIIVCAAGGLPGELHKLWRASQVGGYHLEYGYSCMGYEIAGGLGVKMAHPDRAVTVMVGDGSYLMMNSEIATSVMLGFKLTIVVLNNGGFGCIDRLQRGTGGQSFNNLLSSTRHETLPELDFAAHAASLGATSEKVTGIAELEAALDRARGAERTYVIVIDTDPTLATEAGGHWWDVAIPEVSQSESVRAARSEYEQATKAQKVGE